MRTLRPVPLKDRYWRDLQRQIQKTFYDTVYRDLFNLIESETELQNDNDVLIRALKDRQISYYDGKFVGNYNASITKNLRAIGAKFNKLTKTWDIRQDLVPIELSMTMARREIQDKELNQSAVKIINEVDFSQQINDNDLLKVFEKNIETMANQIDKSIGIKFSLTDEQRENIATDWTNNLDLYIKDFMQENVTQLRNDVMKNVSQGQRANNLVKSIQNRYNVTKSKAQFLARQETSLLMSKMRETRYTGAGINKYKWKTANNERVRDRHRELNGNVYQWSTPPIINEKGDRGHPGEDFNCRCVAVPIVE